MAANSSQVTTAKPFAIYPYEFEAIQTDVFTAYKLNLKPLYMELLTGLGISEVPNLNLGRRSNAFQAEFDHNFVVFDANSESKTIQRFFEKTERRQIESSVSNLKK